MPQDTSKDGSRRSTDASKAPQDASKTPQDTSRRPKTPPRWRKTPPRRLQDALKTLQDPQRRLQDASRHPHSRPKTLQRRLQGAPRHLKHVPRHFQEAPGRLQDAFKISCPRIQRKKQHAISLWINKSSLTQLSHSYIASRVPGQQCTQMDKAYVAENKTIEFVRHLMQRGNMHAFITLANSSSLTRFVY